jgi:hypothetical protein
MDYRVKDATGATVDPHTCVFPILKEIGDGTTQLVGTGFFITIIGHFVTAKHVIFDAVDEDTLRQKGFLHALHFVEGEKALVRHITNVCFHNSSDIAVGKMDFHVLNATGEPLRNRIPCFTTEPPRIGSKVVTFAYPESDRIFGKGSSTFVPKFYSGELLDHSDRPRDNVMVRWPHYVTSISTKGGASGGPVFDERGRVFAINSVGGFEGLSYMPRATELLSLRIPEFPSPSTGEVGECTVLELAQHRRILFDPPINSSESGAIIVRA